MMVGCSNNDGAGTDNGVEMWSRNVVVKTSDWVEDFLGPDDYNRYYYCEIEEPRVTKNFIYNNGRIDIERETKYDNQTSVITPLPITRLLEGLDKNGEYIEWVEVIDYEYEPGWIVLYMTTSDHAPLPPAAMNFRIHFTLP